jgi:PPM family protein phosphatase
MTEDATLSLTQPIPVAAPDGPGSGNLVPDAAWASDVGRMRDHNEDCVAGTAPGSSDTLERGYLFLVADGMGGHNAGEVASNEAVRGVYSRYYADREPDVHSSLDNAVRQISAELYMQAQANQTQQGMGTTLATAVVKGRRLYVANVGDSRVYLIRQGQVQQLTQDHSWVEEQVRGGVLTRAEATSHPQRNIITRALAAGPDVKVDHFEHDLAVGDVVVLCSDGLTNEVSETQIALEAGTQGSPRDAVAALLKMANDHGGADNISVIVARLGEDQPVAREVGAGRRGISRRLVWVFILSAVFLVLLIIGLLLIVRSWRGTSPTKTPPAPTSIQTEGKLDNPEVASDAPEIVSTKAARTAA